MPRWYPEVNGGKGRSYGVLDAYSFVEMLDAVALLEQSDSFTVQDSQRLKAWFSDLLDWMLTSTQGVEESRHANNHGTAYDAQAIAFALYTGRKDLALKLIGEFPQKRTFRQIEPDGSQPLELSRTLAFHYSWYNLNHYADICLMAEKLGADIHHAESPDGRSFYKALDFLVPYIGTEGKTWPYRQINSWTRSRRNCAGTFTGLRPFSTLQGPAMRTCSGSMGRQALKTGSASCMSGRRICLQCIPMFRLLSRTGWRTLFRE